MQETTLCIMEVASLLSLNVKLPFVSIIQHAHQLLNTYHLSSYQLEQLGSLIFDNMLPFLHQEIIDGIECLLWVASRTKKERHNSYHRTMAYLTNHPNSESGQIQMLWDIQLPHKSSKITVRTQLFFSFVSYLLANNHFSAPDENGRHLQASDRIFILIV